MTEFHQAEEEACALLRKFQAECSFFPLWSLWRHPQDGGLELSMSNGWLFHLDYQGDGRWSLNRGDREILTSGTLPEVCGALVQEVVKRQLTRFMERRA